jgi:hypothetical protein
MLQSFFLNIIYEEQFFALKSEKKTLMVVSPDCSGTPAENPRACFAFE